MKLPCWIVTSVVSLAILVMPAAASADPFQMTDWNPQIDQGGSAGKYHATATNPNNGRVLVFGYKFQVATISYFSQVFSANGAPIGDVHEFDFGEAAYGQTYGAAYNPVTGGWVVSYVNPINDTAVARFLNADGTADGAAKVLNTSPVEDCCQSTDIAYSTKDKRFLVAWSEYDSTGFPTGRFVSANGTVEGASEFDLMSSSGDLFWDDYHQLAIDYSPKQDNFGLVVKSYPSSGGDPYRPWFQLLDSTGSPIGSQRMLQSNNDDSTQNPDMAYNAARDEYGVIWIDLDETDYPAMFQRIKASDGSSVGAPTAQDSFPDNPAGSFSNGIRVKLVAHPTADQYYMTTNAAYFTGIYGEAAIIGWKTNGNGTQVSDSPEWLTTPASYDAPYRAQVTFNAYDCTYLSTYETTTNTVIGADLNVYGSKTQAARPCKSASKPFLKAKGNGGTDSLMVKVGCADSGACRIRLTGKLKGGSGKLVKRTVKVKAGKKSTVLLGYSDLLRQELASSGGGKIRVTAKEIGGRSSSTTVRVPQSVTG